MTEEKELWERLREADKPIVLYGMGNGADKVLDHLEELSIPVSGVFASDGFVRGKSFRGFQVCSYGEAKEKFGDMIVLVCFGSSRPEVLENIRRIAGEQELYAPDVPVYGSGVFDRAYYNAHRRELDTVRDMLCDEQSRLTFESVISYKLTGRTEYLERCQTSTEEAFENILCLGEKERYLDLGAFTGDTVGEFLRFTGGRYESITAVEPDKKSFARLQKATARLERCRLVPCGVSDRYGRGSFQMRGGRNSAASQVGEEITFDSVDNITLGRQVSYIKMDVEGQEAAAIRGATATIRRFKPKMLVSAYHRNEDIYALPLQVKELCPEYKVYMRHYPYVPAWDMNYYFVL
ncbi:MAG: FkbM family methyltransferase [Oscillospiraceae bacterium]|nr:FkbM family methyltransferase [Oscillospiraceae bacterium]